MSFKAHFVVSVFLSYLVTKTQSADKPPLPLRMVYMAGVDATDRIEVCQIVALCEHGGGSSSNRSCIQQYGTAGVTEEGQSSEVPLSRRQARLHYRCRTQ